MEIVVLDALTLGLNIDLGKFKKFGHVQVYNVTQPEEVGDRIKSAEIVITNKVVIDKNIIENAKELKLICVAATGYNNIDLQAASKNDIIVANVRNYSTESVAQHTFSMILALENSLVDYITDTRAGLWGKSDVFTMITHPFNELCGKTMGIIGYGAIGKRVAEIARVFGMQVLIGRRKGIVYQDHERVDFERLLIESDIISIHTPLSENTHNLFTYKEFEKMKNSAIIVNMARGGIVNEQDLYKALENKTIRAAAIDVAEIEPMSSDNKLLSLNNILISPHIAWASVESRNRLIDGIVKNIEIYIDGNGSEINLAI
jgi:glycerate dehydrogenase